MKTLIAILCALTLYVPQGIEPKPIVVVMEVEKIERGEPDAGLLAQHEEAQRKVAVADSDAKRAATEKRAASLAQRADASRPYFIFGVAKTDDGPKSIGLWFAGASTFGQKPTAGSFVRARVLAQQAERLDGTAPLEFWYGGVGHSHHEHGSDAVECQQLRIVERPENWPDTRTVPRQWEQPDEKATADAKLSVELGSPTLHTGRAADLRVGHVDLGEPSTLEYPVRITNGSGRTIRAARFILECIDHSEFVVHTASGLTVADLADAASKELPPVEVVLRGGNVSGARIKVCFVEFAP